MVPSSDICFAFWSTYSNINNWQYTTELGMCRLYKYAIQWGKQCTVGFKHTWIMKSLYLKNKLQLITLLRPGHTEWNKVWMKYEWMKQGGIETSTPCLIPTLFHSIRCLITPSFSISTLIHFYSLIPWWWHSNENWNISSEYSQRSTQKSANINVPSYAGLYKVIKNSE